MALLGYNGGLRGKPRIPSTGNASGLWDLEEHQVAKGAGIWPLTNGGSVVRTVAFATSNIVNGQIGINSQNSGLWWIHKRNLAGNEDYLETILQAMVLAPKPYVFGIANQATPASVISYTITDNASYANDPAQDVFWISFTGPNLVGDTTYIISYAP